MTCPPGFVARPAVCGAQNIRIAHTRPRLAHRSRPVYVRNDKAAAQPPVRTVVAGGEPGPAVNRPEIVDDEQASAIQYHPGEIPAYHVEQGVKGPGTACRRTVRGGEADADLRIWRGARQGGHHVRIPLRTRDR